MASCESCPSKDKCGDKDRDNCMIENNPINDVKHIIGVMSGKGGVGKSTVSVLLAHDLMKKGYKVGILDADITGPSIPRLLGLQDKRATILETGIIPVFADNGLKVMSLNFLVDEENTPVIWRGPIIAGTVKQFWTDVLWEELDYLIVDLPPGTGDVALTVMQVMPLTGVVMVSVPQDMVSMIVAKAINMAKKMNVDVLGVIENMSYIQCPDCDTQIKMFDGDIKTFLDTAHIPLLGELPMTKSIINVASQGINHSDEAMTLFEPITNKIIKELE
ncbi:Mrp/NBP35 family ATP-binding protein [Vallitalea pronyensis]|uniref:Iron-sulfur cluster carrier protein n=1 Tax=Vallitalea pronyensis TaxID=1348613 RepID=A0A8J8SGS6_9FIRM|nr:Mrp/NBP35 family ATP-binding protein [Vallitalea pronyensis]QUI22694.1 Mrp/NBP35 family ATP-binding protein [Vallitalea pronyensis]